MSAGLRGVACASGAMVPSDGLGNRLYMRIPKPAVATAMPMITPFIVRPDRNCKRSRKAAVKQKRLRCSATPNPIPRTAKMPNSGSHRLPARIRMISAARTSSPASVCGCTLRSGRAGNGTERANWAATTLPYHISRTTTTRR